MNAADQLSIFDVWPDAEYPGLHRDIRAAIAAAVAAEREACATLAEIREMRYREHDMFPAYGMDGLASEAHDIAAAIRARGNGRE